MSFNSTGLAASPRNRVRLLIGDIAHIPWLDDGVYNYILQQNNMDELKAAYDLLKYVESRITLEPQSSSGGFVKEEAPALEYIAIRKKELDIEIRKRDGGYVVPVIMTSDRKNWNDIDSIFSSYK